MVLLALGCEPHQQPASLPAQAAVDPDLPSQIAAVAREETKRLLVEAQPVRTDDLQKLSGTQVAELLIDHPDSHVETAWQQVDLPNLAHLRFRGTGIDDQALNAISRYQKLLILNVPRGEFTDAGLASLTALPQLEMLRFGSPHVTDAGMKTLAEFPALKRLHLIGVPITDAGLAELAKLEQLESLYIDDTQLSDAAWKALFEARPKLHVHINQQHHDRDPHQHGHAHP